MMSAGTLASPRPALRWAARAAASGVLLGSVVWLTDPDALLSALTSAQPLWMGLAVLSLLGQIVLSALRWRITARALGLPISTRAALQEYGLSVLVNTFLPGGVLGDMGRILRMKHLNGWRRSAASVIIERLAGQVMLGLAALLGLVWWLGLTGIVIALAVIGLALVALRLSGRVLPRVHAALKDSWFHAAIWHSQIMLSLLILICNLFGFWAAARSVGVDLSLSASLLILPLTLAVMLFPVTINGWGLREGTAALLWPMVGVTTTGAVSASVLFGIAIACAACLGAVPWLLSGASAVDTGASPGIDSAPDGNTAQHRTRE